MEEQSITTNGGNIKKVTVIVNKNWETEPVINALTNPKLRPAALPFPKVLNSPKDGNNKMSEPRAIFHIPATDGGILQVTVRCIEDLMSPAANPSSSEEKYRVLPAIIKADAPQLVISVSTANYPVNEPQDDGTPSCGTSTNGSVVLGDQFFLHDGHPGNPESNLQSPYVGQLLTGNVPSRLFEAVKEFAETVTARFITPPNYPAPIFTCHGATGYSAISSINVTDYTEYDRVDQESVDHFHAVAPNALLRSIETTHAVVRISTDCPVLFLSPITDRLGHFEDVNDIQNYVCAFNGGLVLGELLCRLYDLLPKQPDVPTTGGTILLSHTGAYVARFYIDWQESLCNAEGGKSLENRSWKRNGDSLTSPFHAEISLPDTAVNIHVKAVEDAGPTWDFWRTIIDQDVKLHKKICISIYGTKMTPYNKVTYSDATSLT